MLKFELNNQEIDSPIGWESLTATLRRDEVYHGIDFKIETSLVFIKSGYDFIKPYIDSLNFDADIELKLWNGNNMIRRFTLNLFDYREDCKQITVPVTEINFFEKLKNRESLEIDLWRDTGIDGQALSVVDKLPYDFTFTPIPLVFLSTLEETNFDFTGEILLPNTQTGFIRFRGIPPLNVLLGEIIQTTGGGNYVMNVGGTGELLPFYIDNRTQVPPLPGDYVITWDIAGKIGDFSASSRPRQVDWEINLVYGDINNPTVLLLDSGNYSSGAIATITQNYASSGTLTVALPSNSVVYIVVALDGFFSTGGGGGSDIYEQGIIESTWYLEVELTNELPGSSAKSAAIYEAMNRVLESITGTNDVLKSDFYGRTNSQPTSYDENGCGAFRVITNGANIRRFNNTTDSENVDYRPPVISWAMFFDSMNAIDNIGMDVAETKVIIESKDYFYADELIKDLGEIDNVVFSINKEKYYTEIEIGYKEYEDQYQKGIFEFASQRQYTTKIKNNKSLYTQLSDLVASPFAIEKTRRDLKEYKPTSSTQWDDANFIIQAAPVFIAGEPFMDRPNTKNISTFATPVGRRITSVTNASDSGDDLYNIEISPNRNLLRHQNMMQNDLSFVSGKGNYKMLSIVENYGCIGVFGGNELSEQQDLTKTSPLFIPIMATFEFPSCLDEFFSWNLNKYGYFEFTFRGIIYKGFIESLQFNEETNLCNFELILKA